MSGQKSYLLNMEGYTCYSCKKSAMKWQFSLIRMVLIFQKVEQSSFDHHSCFLLSWMLLQLSSYSAECVNWDEFGIFVILITKKNYSINRNNLFWKSKYLREDKLSLSLDCFLSWEHRVDMELNSPQTTILDFLNNIWLTK